MSKRHLVVGLVCALAIGVGLGTYVMFRMPPLKPHVGDGVFKDISFRFGPFPIRGYSIDFPRLKLRQKLAASYRIADLPRLGSVGVYFVVIGPSEHCLDGDLDVKVLDSAGKTVVDVQERLGRMIWSSHYADGQNCYALYDLDKSFFEPRRGMAYQLTVSFSPDEESIAKRKPITGGLYMRCGGYL